LTGPFSLTVYDEGYERDSSGKNIYAPFLPGQEERKRFPTVNGGGE
jgi:hypothetical protein